MVNQKINKKLKKSESTLASVVFSVLIVMGLFFGFYLWIDANGTDADLTMDNNYTSTYTQLQGRQTELSNSVDELKSTAKNVTEADSSFASAWNGLKGLILVAKIPFQFVDTAISTFDLMITPLVGILPAWAKPLIGIGLLAILIFIIWSIMKGDPNVIR